MAMVFSVWLTGLTPGTPVIVVTTTSVVSCSIASWSLIADSEVAGTTSALVLSCANVARLTEAAPARRSALLTTTVCSPRNGLPAATRSKLFQVSVTLSLV